MTEVYILGAARTAIGGLMGTLKAVPAHKLGSIAIKEALQRAGVKAEQVEEVIMGCVLQAGQGQGPGRQAALGAGIPEDVPAWAINQLCGSGLKTVGLAVDAIKAGNADCIVAGGMESMSQSPHLSNLRNGTVLGHVSFQDSMLVDGLTDVFSGEHMGMTAEWLADEFKISREEQDKYAAESVRRAVEAWEKGHFDKEIVPVEIPQRKGDPIVFKKDEHFRPNTSVDTLAKLRPAFKKDGSVTAGNASGINDGAAALVIASADFVKKHNLKPLAKIVSHATTALNPSRMGVGPVSATRKALEKAGWKLEDLDRVEANEAFAVQSLSVIRELGLDTAKTNVNGGAIALGHPIGASGARILVTLLYEMMRSDCKKGLATLCVGGGMGVAATIERV
ncbi:MAG: acetyl-CoA C-acetyltransferase [Clostridiales bacterium]|jgi:acetyl-CoA C-acetyltransferase|nr:acetyl-CoA C-acetyltransferase [Clostridiales bacterium]MDN5281317.1 acetyl-CoA C-acetyltransferase [Candidatus Ozemobacter sp.]